MFPRTGHLGLLRPSPGLVRSFRSFLWQLHHFDPLGVFLSTWNVVQVFMTVVFLAGAGFEGKTGKETSSDDEEAKGCEPSRERAVDQFGDNLYS